MRNWSIDLDCRLLMGTLFLGCMEQVVTTTTLSREALERACSDEKDADTRLRMLLVLKVKYDGLGQNQAARELNALSSWAAKWVGRFEEEGLEGLRTRERSGRPPGDRARRDARDKE